MKTLFNLLILFIGVCASCNLDDGIDGLTSLINVKIEPMGNNCLNGGIKIETGIDINRDGILSSNEVQDSVFICNGEDGLISLVNTSDVPPGDICPVGGTKLEVGLDTNRNGILDSSEIQQVHFICDGPFQSVIRLTIKATVTGAANSKWDSTHWKNFNSDLIKFNINNYTGIDSVFFIVAGAMTSDSTSNVFFDLVDLAKDQEIQGSLVKTKSTSEDILKSCNILDSLPNFEFDLGWRIKTEKDGIQGSANGSFLFLYRK